MLTTIGTRLRGFRQRRRVARELDDELRFHVEMETAANIERGLESDQARRVALRDFGGVVQTKEAVRDVRTMAIESIGQDLLHAVKNLRTRPGVGVTAAAMLGLGIGITTAMFTLVDALILRPVPFRAADQLAFVYMGNDRGGRTTVAPAVLRAWREVTGFAGAESAVPDTAIVEAGGRVVTRGLARVTPGLFNLLGNVQPIRGRLFDASEGRPGTDDRVLLSEDLWRGLYGADPALVGRRVVVDGDSLLVVGILPAEFRFPQWDTVIWRPIDVTAPPAARAGDSPMAYVRFAPDVPRADALRLAGDAARAADPRNAKLRPIVQPLAGLVMDAYYQRAVPLLAGGVVLVFLVLCANACSLLLAGFTARRREFSTRAALGAARGRMLRQALVESGVIGALGVLVGAAVGWALVSLTRGFLPEAFLLRTLNPLDIDPRALAVTSASGVVASLIAGVLPAWMATRVDAGDALRAIERAGTETRAARLVTRTLLVAEVALSCTLLVGATLLVRSFINLSNAGRGLDADGVITASVLLPASAFPDRPARAAAADLLEQQVRRLAGVQHVAWSSGVPPDGGAITWGDWLSDLPAARAVHLEVDRYQVGPDFFALYGIRLLRGRTFQPSDPPEAVIVGERMARSLWPGLDPIGHAFSIDAERFTVIGLTGEIHHPSLNASLDRPEFYERFAGFGGLGMMSIRCSGRCVDEALVRQRLVAAHPGVQVWEVGALEAQYFEQLARPRAAAALGFAFAAVAVLAAAGGLFSVLSYAVGRRRREFGIRTALGAAPAEIRRGVIREGLVVTVTGVALGTIAAAALGRALASLQYGVTPADPLSWGLVVGLLGLTAVAASWRPARQASRVNPVVLLRDA